MTFAMTGANPRLCDKKTAFTLLDRFLEAGGNFIDTADVYSVGGDKWHVTSCDTCDRTETLSALSENGWSSAWPRAWTAAR